MRGRRTPLRLVAVAVTAALIGASGYALVARGHDQPEAHGLRATFTRIDNAYSASTQEFVDQAKDLAHADLAETVRLYSSVLRAATTARDAVAELRIVNETRHATERMERALRVQVMSLTAALTSVRNRDEKGAADASKQFEVGVLAYRVARDEMLAALASCGDRCA